MKPYGRTKNIKGRKFKVDYRIRVANKKVGNWWEDMCAYLKCSSLKQIWKKEISKEI